MDRSIKDLPTPPMSTVSAQATKRATWGEHEVGLSWFSLRQRSKSINSLEQPCLILWITGLLAQMNFTTLYLMKFIKNVGALQSIKKKDKCEYVSLLWWCTLRNLHLQFMAPLLPCWWVGGNAWPICLHVFLTILCSYIYSSLPERRECNQFNY